MIAFKAGDIIIFDYRNHKGIKARRQAVFRSLEHGVTPHHPNKAQWHLRCYCLDRQAERSFQLEGVNVDTLSKR